MIGERLQLAETLAREGGALALEASRDRSKLVIEKKGLQDLVTAADKAVEAMIVSRLRTAFPDDNVLGEEGGLAHRGAPDAPLWAIDPIDGTANYARGLPLWCVSVGVIIGGRAVAGAIFNPMTGELHAGSSETPATLNGKTIHVSAIDDPQRARANLGFSYRRPVAPHAETVRRLLEAGCEYSRFGSGALGMAYVADGRFEAYFEPHINVWDVAAGIAIVEAAGGRCNDFLAGNAVQDGNAILATTPALWPWFERTLMPLTRRVA